MKFQNNCFFRSTNSATVAFFCLLFFFSKQSLFAQEWRAEPIQNESNAAIFADLWQTEMSDDGNTIVVSDMLNAPSRTRVYIWNGEAWVQKGGDFEGAPFEGFSTSLSSDGNTLAIGAPLNRNKGEVQVYTWNDLLWTKKGPAISGVLDDDGAGWSVDLSNDGHTMAIGSTTNDDNGADAGHVRVFEWDDENWIQKGNPIVGETAGDWSGVCVKLSGDGATVAIGAARNDAAGEEAGHVRVFKWKGLNWQQMGTDLEGYGTNSYSGVSLDLSEDGHTLAVSAPGDTRTELTIVKVYQWNEAEWSQKGEEILGLANWQDLNIPGGSTATFRSTTTVSLSADGDRVLLGDYRNDAEAEDAGYVGLYQWNGTWNKMTPYMFGEKAGVELGWSISMNAKGDRFITSNGADFEVYRLVDEPVGFETVNVLDLKVYPNPTTEKIVIELDKLYNSALVSIHNVLGQQIAENSLNNSQRLSLDLLGPAGIYFVYIKTEEGEKIIQIVKE